MRNKIRHKIAILCGSLLKAFNKGTAHESRMIPVSNIKTLSRQLIQVKSKNPLTSSKFSQRLTERLPLKISVSKAKIHDQNNRSSQLSVYSRYFKSLVLHLFTIYSTILLKVSFNILPPQTFKHIHFKPPTQSDVLCGSMFFFLLAIATCSGQPPQR